MNTAANMLLDDEVDTVVDEESFWALRRQRIRKARGTGWGAIVPEPTNTEKDDVNSES